MTNRNTDSLFLLIKSLKKAEKRNFKLYIKRNSSNEDLKIIRIFDVLDKQEVYNEQPLLKKLPGTEKRQLYNLKAHLYKEILASLRLLKSSDSIDLQLNELLDYGHILYKKGMFEQSLRILDRAKDLAKTYHKYYFLNNLLSLEKRIETLHITRDMESKMELLVSESEAVATHISNVTRLSNVSMQLFSWFTQHGHVRNQEEQMRLKAILSNSLPENAHRLPSFYERLYFYQAMCWYTYIRQDFLQYYRYAQKWVDMFDEDPLRIRLETSHYIKGMHYLLNAHFDLRNYSKFDKVLENFKVFAQTERVTEHNNFLVQTFLYISQAQINQHFMQGTFSEGLKFIPVLQERLKEYQGFIDPYRILVLRYKIAILYFGSGDYSTCIDYLQRIINVSGDMRTDLQSYARLVHLMAHFELGNDEILESLSRSVYRFMAKMKNITDVDQEIFKFLRNTRFVNSSQFKPELKNLLNNIKHFEKDPLQTRAFAYIDIISWVESKVYGTTLEKIAREKYLQSKRA